VHLLASAGVFSADLKLLVLEIQVSLSDARDP
jgi:hypothetical protein